MPPRSHTQEVLQALEDLTVERLRKQKDQEQLLQNAYVAFIKEFSFFEKQLQKARLGKEDPLQNLEQAHQYLVEDFFVLTQKRERFCFLEQEQWLPLYLGFFTDSFYNLFFPLVQKKTYVTTHKIVLQLLYQETEASVFLQQAGLSLSQIKYLESLPDIEKTPEEEKNGEKNFSCSPELQKALKEALLLERLSNWTKLSTEHLLLGILRTPVNAGYHTLKHLQVDLLVLTQKLKKSLALEEELEKLSLQEEEQPENFRKGKKEWVMKKENKREGGEEWLLLKEKQERQLVLLKEIREALQEQGKRTYELQKHHYREHRFSQGVIFVLIFLLFLLSCYVALIVFY